MKKLKKHKQFDDKYIKSFSRDGSLFEVMEEFADSDELMHLLDFHETWRISNQFKWDMYLTNETI